MKKYLNYDLYRYNSMRLHCIAKVFYEPETIEELRSLVSKLSSCKEEFHILGGGSNILMPDTIGNVVSLRNIPTEIKITNNIVEVTASTSIQHLIRECQKYELGGIEYLFTLPCQLGGAVFMNAGRGGKNGKSISDYVKSITYIVPSTGEIKIIEKEECNFGHRYSVFQEMDCIIVNVRLQLELKASNIIENDIKERLNRSKKYLDASKPSCGSVFCQCNSWIMKFLKGKKKGNAQYSNKTSNWISNNGGATYYDIIRLINLAVKLHKFFFQKYKIEIIIWK